MNRAEALTSRTILHLRDWGSIALGLLLAVSALAERRYDLLELQPLDGNANSFVDARRINEAGQVVGSSGFGLFVPRATLWTHGQ
ncbi:MAG: hypothetical protein KC488_02920, partial [Candidatus Cloacimonetes bacterium]|nr:hypothetical protein [Candidatus Cloacimonadota bacterium]